MVNINTKTLQNYTITVDSTFKDALEKLNKLSNELTLFVIDHQNKLVGTITDGDIRRVIILGSNLDENISIGLNKNCKKIFENNIDHQLLKKYSQEKIFLIPIVDQKESLKGYLNLNVVKTILPLDVIYMAGGKGERLRPLTINTPKPMLPLNGKPILDHNITRLIQFGIVNVTISVNYLKENIKQYFGTEFFKGIKIDYIEENIPLGTLGSVCLKNNYQNEDLLVMNSDILSNINFEELYDFYKRSDSDMVIATIGYNVNVPYAVIETKNHLVTALKEKPSYTYQSNAGIYIFKKKFLKYIPRGEKYDTTDLIEKLINEGRKVVSFQILDYWLDIGRHEDYEKAQQDIRFLKL
jgi:dTDP-glucose pyrophosphorylase/CBS domain-containing protein